ncbi:MAG: hypothetical protein KDD53_05325 [Bdellovibrionales bacterium]|nr:hypothetical protein [Bdellovibrionales bacterium]
MIKQQINLGTPYSATLRKLLDLPIAPLSLIVVERSERDIKRISLETHSCITKVILFR